MNANFFRRLTLGMALVSQVLLAYEDKKLSKEELVSILNNLFIGLGMEGVNFAGLSVSTDANGDMLIRIPANVLKVIG